MGDCDKKYEKDRIIIIGSEIDLWYNICKNRTDTGKGACDRTMGVNLKEIAGAYFRLVPKDMGDLSRIEGKGMVFHAESYEAEGAGALCLLHMEGTAGLMTMESAAFTPSRLDGPILSMDRICANGEETLLLELIDTVLSDRRFPALEEVKNRYADLPVFEPKRAWYSDLHLPGSAFYRGREIGKELDQLLREYSEAYFAALLRCPVCDPVEKSRKNAVLPEGLLSEGGPAADQFKAMLGEEKTAVFMKKYMFCCEQ